MPDFGWGFNLDFGWGFNLDFGWGSYGDPMVIIWGDCMGIVWGSYGDRMGGSYGYSTTTTSRNARTSAITTLLLQTGSGCTPASSERRLVFNNLLAGHLT